MNWALRQQKNNLSFQIFFWMKNTSFLPPSPVMFCGIPGSSVLKMSVDFFHVKSWWVLFQPFHLTGVAQGGTSTVSFKPPVGATMGKVPKRMASICTKPQGSHLQRWGWWGWSTPLLAKVLSRILVLEGCCFRFLILPENGSWLTCRNTIFLECCCGRLWSPGSLHTHTHTGFSNLEPGYVTLSPQWPSAWWTNDFLSVWRRIGVPVWMLFPPTNFRVH